jgi:membrane protease YdiL (CAAX protease family)
VTERAATRGERAIVLTITALLIVVPLFPLLAIPAAVAIVVVTVIAWQRRQQAASSLGLFAVACIALTIAGVGPQQVLFPIAFGIYFLVVWRVPWLRRATSWLKRGDLNATLLALAAGVAAVAGLGLVVWYVTFRPDLTDLFQTYVPEQPLWVLMPGAIVFSMLNAAIEEAAYRGIVLSALDAVLGHGAAPIVLQAAAFGALHMYGGFPRGVVGVALAFVYGAALGALRRKAGGLLVLWIAHVLTDVVIFSIVIALSRA